MLRELLEGRGSRMYPYLQLQSRITIIGRPDIVANDLEMDGDKRTAYTINVDDFAQRLYITLFD